MTPVVKERFNAGRRINCELGLYGSQPDLVLHSSRKAIRGSTQVARRAGMTSEKRHAFKNCGNEKEGDRIGWSNPEKHD